MNNYVTAVFDTDAKAYEALHALWRLDDTGEVTVHGAAVVRRDRAGYIDVGTKTDEAGIRTVVGAAVGALLGALAGPLGSAMGIAGASAIAAGSAAGLGAAAGGAAGFTADTGKALEYHEAGSESRVVIKPGQAAVVADVAEDWTTPIDTEMNRLGGKVYRRSVSAVRTTSLFGDDYDYYLYPYDYKPEFA